MVGAEGTGGGSPVDGTVPEDGAANQPTVLVAAGNGTRLDRYESWIADGPTVRTADTAGAAIEALEQGVAVTVLGYDLAGDRQTLRHRIAAIAPDCRVALCHYPYADPEIDADAVVEIPTCRSTLRSVIDRLLRQRAYERTIERYYRARLREAVLEGTHTDAELAAHEEYAAIERTLEALQKRLAELTAALTDEDFQSIFASIADRGPTDIPALLEGRRDERPGPVAVGSSKYRPDACPECGNEWEDRQHGRDPFVRIGAFVWSCTDCGAIRELPDPSHQRVAFR